MPPPVSKVELYAAMRRDARAGMSGRFSAQDSSPEDANTQVSELSPPNIHDREPSRATRLVGLALSQLIAPDVSRQAHGRSVEHIVLGASRSVCQLAGSLRALVLGWLCRLCAGTALVAGPDGRLQQHRSPGGMGSDVGASLPQPVQGLAIAEGEGGLQAGTVVEFGQVQDGIDQAGAHARGQVPGRGAQRRPGVAVRFL
jgi:hypothetical protein